MKVLFKIGSEKKGFSLSIITETDSRLRGFNFLQWLFPADYISSTVQLLHFRLCSICDLSIDR